jgi:hypothetical protein
MTQIDELKVAIVNLEGTIRFMHQHQLPFAQESYEICINQIAQMKHELADLEAQEMKYMVNQTKNN